MASRLSTAILKEDILGPEQNRFRPGRSCQDNLFVLNTILGKYKNENEIHLCFIDIAAAYDSVNRSILWGRLEKLNLPTSVLMFLINYYTNDNISSTMGEETSRVHYQTRGLCQGRIIIFRP